MFSKVCLSDSCSLYFLGIPIARKESNQRSSTLKIIGIPVYRVIRDGFEVRIKVFGVTVNVRPNWQSIDETVRKFASAISERLSGLEQRLSPERMKLEMALNELDMYKYIGKVRTGGFSLEDELEIVGKIAERWESDDE